MHAQVVTVTAKMANDWLKKNDKNRKLNVKHVSKLAEQMRSGRWSLNGQTISFDENGRLLDGQHRLHAVILSGVPVQMMVVTGVTDPEAFKTYDGHVLKRGAAQVADMMGLKNSNNAIATARIVLAYENAKTFQDFAASMTKATNESPAEIAEVALEMAEEIEHAMSIVPGSLTKNCAWRSGAHAMALIFNRVDPVATSEFYTKIRSGSFTGEDDPCLQLRDRMMTGRGSMGANDWKRTMAAITIKAFNSFRKGKPIANLRWRIKGDCPESFPAIDGATK